MQPTVLNPSSGLYDRILTYYHTECSELIHRRYDLDALRILAFGLLFLFHIGMFYVANWGFHAKSHYRSEWLESVMLIIEPWRMPVIWFISGAALRFIFYKVSLKRLVLLRSYRILLPLLFGVLCIVPPQLFIEMSVNGDLNTNYWQFLLAFFTPNHPMFEQYQAGIWPHIDVNHLWYLRSLWYYSLGLLMLVPLLHLRVIVNTTKWLGSLNPVVFIILLTLPIFIIQISYEQHITRYPIGFTFMLYGYLFGWQTVIWQRFALITPKLVVTFLFALGVFISFYNLVWLDVVKGQNAPEHHLLLGMVGYSFMRIIGLIMVLALAVKYLSKPSKRIKQLNEAVFPFYILHQTFILVIGFYLSALSLGPILEPLLLVLLTVISCLLAYEVIRRINLLRPFFGLKITTAYPAWWVKMGYTLSAIVLIPLVWQLVVALF